MGEVDVPNCEVFAGLVLEVKLESELTLGVVVETVGWGVVSDDGVDISVGHAGAEHADTCGWCAYADMRMMHADAFRIPHDKAKKPSCKTQHMLYF